MSLVSITRADKTLAVTSGKKRDGSILLVKPPYFSPWTPPLGISILKTFLEQQGYVVKCFDFNTDPDLWGMHHQYFSTLQTLESVSINDGYSKLWWILNAHMLAYANDASPDGCGKVLERITPYYGITINQPIINTLIPLVDRFFKRMKELVDQFDLSGFSTVGTSTYTTSLGPSLFLLKHIKRAFPHIKTIMGGGVFADDLALESDNLHTLVREYDFVDHIILGEGELLLLKLLQGEFADKRVISLADLRGKTLEMKEVPVPDFSDTNPESYYHLSIEGARSCPFQCSFCSETIQWGNYRKKPITLFAEQVVDLATRYHNNSFFMGDSLMNPYINPFATRLLEMNASILYDGYLRADKPVTHRDYVKLWADSGCYRVRLGIESAAVRVLDAMDKMTTPKVISDVLKTLANEGIRTTTYWIVGFPGETEEDFQETCDFIREHHRFIYELEAHPYYYYPYGQIGSRLYQCYSLYPEEVTDVIKFKVWDIEGAQPAREERYDRLRRISKLASDLGLPNIYTMAERYAAERRWHLLYPTTVEVYEGTLITRDRPSLPETSLEVFAPQWRGRQATAHDTEDVLCYHVSVDKRLDDKVLTAAVRELIESHGMLQMRFQDGQYVPTPLSASEQGEQFVKVYEADEAAAVVSHEDIIERLSAEIRPEPKAALRVALIHQGPDSSEFLLLGHKAIADGRSLILLCEDLYRLYEQLSNNKKVSLKPIEKTYAAMVAELAVNDRDLARESLPDQVKNNQTLISIEVVSAALLDLLAQSNGNDPLCVDSHADYRLVDEKLKDTVATLTVARNVPDVILRDPDSRSRVRKLGRFFREHTTEEPERSGTRVLLNLECFVEEPWLGGSHYIPQGFMATGNSKPREPYLLEVAPFLTRDGVQLHLKYQTSAAALARKLLRSFDQTLESILKDNERYLEDERFWRQEFGQNTPLSNIEMFSAAREDSGAGWTSIPCEIRHDQLESICAQLQSDSTVVLMSALSVLLSRLNGREDVVVLSSIDDTIAPVRLNPFWNLSFGEFVRQVRHKLMLAGKHRAGALEALSCMLYQNGAVRPMFDVGYIFAEASTANGPGVERLQQWHPSSTQNLSIVLEATKKNNDLNLRIGYERSRLGRDVPERINSYLQAIVSEVAMDPGHALSNIVLDKEQHIPDPSAALAQDVFSFS